MFANGKKGSLIDVKDDCEVADEMMDGIRRIVFGFFLMSEWNVFV